MPQQSGHQRVHAHGAHQNEHAIDNLKTIANSTKNNMNILTFLKSNYKYKRRSMAAMNGDADALPVGATNPAGRTAKTACSSNSHSLLFTYIFSVILNNLNQCKSPSALGKRAQHITGAVSWQSMWISVAMAVCLSASSVNAGACWQTSLANGKCKESYSTNITKAECCSNQDFLFTENVVSEIDLFFKTTLGDGIECSPCRESCRNFNCGPNKKCVLRKGRPKCICAPECGGAARRRKQLLLQTQSTGGKRLQRSHHEAWDGGQWVSPRDTRSLSSEITNINLDVNTGGHHHQMRSHANPMRNQNQRKPTQSQDPAAGQQRAPSEMKTKRLLMATTADNPSQTRRIQLISNIRRHKQRNRNGTNIIGAPPPADVNTHGKKHKSNHRKHANDDDKPHRQQQEQHQQQRQYHNHHNNNDGKMQRTKLKHPKAMSPAGSILIVNDHEASVENATDGMTLLGGIDEKFNQHGFPNHHSHQPPHHHHKLTQFESNHHQTHPVCGTDGRTYNTECQLRKRACRTNNPNLKVAYRGYCRVTCQGVKCLNGLTCVEDHYTIPHCIECQINCPHDDHDDDVHHNDDDDDDDDGLAGDADKAGHNNHNNDERNVLEHRAAIADGAIGNDRVRNIVIDTSRAVCGVDGRTYRSTCDINRMICKIGRSIAVAYPGPCRADRVTCNDISCGPKQKCLVDYLTHEPRCVHCRYKCPRQRRPQHQRFEEGKICGVNNRSYNSWCEMRKESCSTGILVDVKYSGECQ